MAIHKSNFSYTYSKCLKSELECISDNQQLFGFQTVQISDTQSSVFRHMRLLEYRVLSSYFRHLRVSEIQTHKSSDFRQVGISDVHISEIYCESRQRQMKIYSFKIRKTRPGFESWSRRCSFSHKDFTPLLGQT